MAAKKRKKTGKMREGECRKTKNGQEYCKNNGEVRFQSQLSGSSSKSRRSTTRRRTTRKGTKGKTCRRYKRVTVKGTRGKQRRCAEFK